MLRLTRRAALLFGAYASLLLAVVVAGFLGSAVGIWAAILWGVAILIGLALYARQRLQRPPEEERET
jgi:FtsH-binding integral membrane protein